MDKKVLIKAFNEWMRRAIDEPDEFETPGDRADVKTEFLREVKEGKEPSYGVECAEYLLSIVESIYSEGHPHGGCCL